MEFNSTARPLYPYRRGGKRKLEPSKYSNAFYPNVIFTGKESKQMFFYTGYNPGSLLISPIDGLPYYTRPGLDVSVRSNSVVYGMLNILDQQPRFVFRPDRYGQYRDMLEKPIDSIVYSLLGKRGPTTPPVVVQFVSASSENPVNPILTNSNNLSVYSTSSLPYFDGENRSRSVPFPSSSLGPFTPTTIVFQT